MNYDFAVRYDPSKETLNDVTKKVLYTLIVKRLKYDKPCVIFTSGESGEGKSISNLRLQEIICEIQNLDFDKYMDTINVYTPLQYPIKLKTILKDKEYKKLNIICMHEAREIISSKSWQSFLPQAIAGVNAMSRSIKPLCIMITSQFIRDITTDVRYTLNYYIKVSRPLGKKAQLKIYKMWKDDTDLDKPKLKKRKVRGYLVFPDGKYKFFCPDYFEVTKPRKELVDRFKKADTEAKGEIITKKLNALIADMEKDLGVQGDHVKKIADWYLEDKNGERLKMIMKLKGKNYKLNPESVDLHNFNPEDKKRFEKYITEQMFKEVELDD